MIDEIRQIWPKEYRLFLIMMTSSANEQLCKDFGFDLIMYFDRHKMQRIVIEKLKMIQKYIIILLGENLHYYHV